MGFSFCYCKYCNVEFGWCSVGDFRSWGEHEKDCKVITNNLKSDKWALYPDYENLTKDGKLTFKLLKTVEEDLVRIK